MPKILAYMTLPDNKIDQLKSLIEKTHGNPKWMEEHAKRTGINSIDAFFAELPTGTAMIVVRDPAESLENWMKSDHPDDKGHLEEAMKIFGMTEEDMAAMDEELKYEIIKLMPLPMLLPQIVLCLFLLLLPASR